MKNEQRTLITEQCKTLKILKRINSEDSLKISDLKTVRTGKKLLVVISGTRTTFFMRVRSWLRMNAGGVLNTCKSNGVNW